MATIVNLVAKLSADVSQFRASMGSVPSILGGVKGALAGLAGSVGFGAIVKSSLDAADAINDLSQRSQLSAEFLSAMEQGVRMAGSSIEVFNRSALRLQKNASLAAGGNKKLAEQFELLGINVQEFAKLAPDEQIRTYVERLSTLEDQGAKVLNVTKLMGGAAAELLPAFNDGAAGLDKMIATAERSNRVLSTDQVAAAAAANDAIDLLNDSFSGLVRNLAINFAPTITAVANGLSLLVATVGPVVREFVGAFVQIGQSLGGVAALVGQLARGNFAGARELLNIERGDLAPTTRAGGRGSGGDQAARETAKNTAEQLRKQDELIRAVRGGVPAVAQ